MLVMIMRLVDLYMWGWKPNADQLHELVRTNLFTESPVLRGDRGFWKCQFCSWKLLAKKGILLTKSGESA